VSNVSVTTTKIPVTITANSTPITVSVQDTDVVTVATPGPQGPPGTASSELGFTHNQTTSSTAWIISHNLGFYPNVQSFDTVGVEIRGTIEHVSENLVHIYHGAPEQGVAYLS
jgi:hypothetical protein